MDDETWELCLQSGLIKSVSQSHRLSHLFLLHRAYSTPI